MPKAILSKQMKGKTKDLGAAVVVLRLMVLIGRTQSQIFFIIQVATYQYLPFCRYLYDGACQH